MICVFERKFRSSSPHFTLDSPAFPLKLFYYNNFNFSVEYHQLLFQFLFQVTTIFGSPIEIHTLFNSDCQRQLNITSLSTIISVGSSLSRSTILRFKSILPLTDLIQMYGQTELATVTLFRPGNAEDKALANLKPESCGRPAMGVQIKVNCLIIVSN